jgi:microcystin degradation protein MlrC
MVLPLSLEHSAMRVAVAGFMHESNTFNPLRTDRAAFESQSLVHGPALLDEWRDAHHEMGGFIEAARTLGFAPVPLVMAWATPSGPVADAVLDEVTDEIIRGVRRERPDGLLLALHGAMVAQSHLDADGEVLSRLRAYLGPDFPIVVSLDLHGNISSLLVDQCQAAVAYRTYPHIDQRECGRRAAALLVRALRGDVRPQQALAKPPLVVNILAQETDREPMKSLMNEACQLEEEPGVLAVSLLPGFAYADVPQMGPSVIAVTDGDAELARRTADALAERLWAVRGELTATPPDTATAVARALRLAAEPGDLRSAVSAGSGDPRRAHEARSPARRPVVLVDCGDNVGGGSAGDGTVLLAEILRQGGTESVVCLFAPEEVRQCAAAGVGREVQLRVGGRVDRLHGEPVQVTGRVRLLHDGNYVEPEPRHGGRRFNQMGRTALLELPGGNLLVLNSQRHPPFSLGQLTCLGIEPARQRILVVKAAVAYKAAYGPIAGAVIEVDTPGLTAVNPERFAYRHRRRPLFPLER